MSYSFTITAPNKSDAKIAIEKHFDEQVIAWQPVHARDRSAVLSNAKSAIDLLADRPDMDVRVDCDGYVSWTTDENAFGAVRISVSAMHTARE